jgi:methyltransferase (TIGR00027 family)
MPITHVSDTAHWVAMYRAMESERADALFDDPFARQMAGDLGESIVREVPHGGSMAWAVIVRTAVMDEMIMDCLERGATRVLNLGAGLDTRAFRLKLPAELRWFDVDLPAMVAHRKTCLKDAKPRCDHTHITADVTDAKALSHAISAAGKVEGPMLVLSEGLLVYLEPALVGSLAEALHLEATAQWWVTDLVSPMLLGMVGSSWPSNEAAASAPFRFAPRDSADFFGRLGWRETTFRSTLDEAIRLGRPPPMAEWWSAFVAPWWPGSNQNVRRMSGVVLMEAARESTRATELKATT